MLMSYEDKNVIKWCCTKCKAMRIEKKLLGIFTKSNMSRY